MLRWTENSSRFFCYCKILFKISWRFRCVIVGMSCAQPAVLCSCLVGLCSLARQQPQLWSIPTPARRLFPETVPHLPWGLLSCWAITVPPARKKCSLWDQNHLLWANPCRKARQAWGLVGTRSVSAIHSHHSRQLRNLLTGGAMINTVLCATWCLS